jgi:flavin reductase (DIM6/NTAB) family NADH-FMN oxidoreductase RutF
VIAIPAVELAATVVAVRTCSGRAVDKFTRFGLTPAPAQQVTAPQVVECLANLACRIADARSVPRHDFFILEVVTAWIDPPQRNPRTIQHRGHGRFVVDGETIRLKSRMP